MINNEDTSLKSYIQAYSEWIEKQIPVNNDWIDDINYMSFVRDEIHKQVVDGQVDPESLATVRTLDAKWQDQIASSIDKNFKYSDKPQGDYADHLWWWHIDRLTELSEQDRSFL